MTNNSHLNFKMNSGGISFERLDGEVVIISFETGKYFNSNNSAADIFYLIENGVPQKEWPKILSFNFTTFDEQSSGISDFLDMALKEKLLLVADKVEITQIDLPSDYVRKEWVKPALLVFDDLADLLLIDPIHDTSTSGWPAQKNE